jgi:hypothetical protein
MRNDVDPKADSAGRGTGDSARKKKAYRTPRLAVYGDLQHLAMAKLGARADGGGKPVTKV